MRLLNRCASVLSWILRRDRAESLLDDEMRSFVEMSAADKIADGVPAAEARRLAQIEIGPGLLTKSVAAAVGEIDPTLAVTFSRVDGQVSSTFMRERLLAILSASFGALALLMAAVGLYGVTSYAVNLRRTEIGIRMALGATRSSVIRLVLGRVAILTGIGIVTGLVVGAWASRFVATLLYGLEPGDPGTLIAAATTLALIGLVAGWLPANRASRLDPTRVLHEV